MLAGASNAGLLRGGQLRGLATTGKKRSPLFPDYPSIAEFYPGYDLTIWLGLFAPQGTPAPIVERLREETRKALNDAELARKLNVTGSLEPLLLSPAEFAELMRADHEKYGNSCAISASTSIAIVTVLEPERRVARRRLVLLRQLEAAAQVHAHQYLKRCRASRRGGAAALAASSSSLTPASASPRSRQH